MRQIYYPRSFFFVSQHGLLELSPRAADRLRWLKAWRAPIRHDRVNHTRGAIRDFLSEFPPGTQVALESVGNWYWIGDEIEEAGCVPLMAHAAKAKVMIPRPSITI